MGFSRTTRRPLGDAALSDYGEGKGYNFDNMGLPDLAEQLVGRQGHDAASTWLADLADRSAAPQGATVRHHVAGEVHLPVTVEGREAVQRFASALLTRASTDPVDWYLGRLQDPSLDLAVHGPEADPRPPDTLCRLAAAETVWNRLASDEDKPTLLFDPATIERWLRDIVCSAAYLDALDPTKRVSGREAPSVFSTFEDDRNTRFPAGTPANRCRQAVGLEPMSTPTAHVLLRYRGSATGPARLPTAFDAGTHPHFLSPAPGAQCGMTKDLAISTGDAGVREVVVRPFPVGVMQQPEFIGA